MMPNTGATTTVWMAAKFHLSKAMERSQSVGLLAYAAFLDGLSNTIGFSERTKGSGFSNGPYVLPTKSDTITMPNRRTNGPVDPEFMFNDCLNYQPAPSDFHFFSMGLWLPKAYYYSKMPWDGSLFNNDVQSHGVPNWIGQDCGAVDCYS